MRMPVLAGGWRHSCRVGSNGVLSEDMRGGVVCSLKEEEHIYIYIYIYINKYIMFFNGIYFLVV